MTNNLNKSEIIKMAVDEYKSTNERFRSAAGIAKKYGINRKTIINYLKKEGFPINNNKATFSINNNVFSKIDSEEKAYWLGFLYADGYVSTNSNVFGMSLSVKDYDHLIKFKSFLEWNGEIKILTTHQFNSKDSHGKNGNLLQIGKIAICNKKIKNDLIKLGCVPQKSLILKFPTKEQVPEKFVLHFIRGYFDGDGTIGKYRHSIKNKRLEESLLIVGTKDMLEQIQKYLGNGFIMQKKNCSEKTFRLGYSTKKAKLAADLMYNNAKIYLNRKYNIYKEQFCRK